MVKWTDHALAQLHHIHDYIADDSSLYAKRVSEAMVRKTVGLDELPYQGHKVPELNEEYIRELGLYFYRIIYEKKPTMLRFLR
jgi:plasmid stabilization system protein ParE